MRCFGSPGAIMVDWGLRFGLMRFQQTSGCFTVKWAGGSRGEVIWANVGEQNLLTMRKDNW